MSIGISLLLSIFTVSQADAALAREAPDAKANRYRLSTIIDSCVAPSFKSVSCVHRKGQTPLDVLEILGPVFEGIRYDGLASAGYALRRAVNASSSMFLDIASDKFTRDSDALESYQIIKTSLINKAQRENLSDCQRACLAKCVSSRWMEPVEYAPDSSFWGAIQSPQGVCRDFAAIAEDLMESLGVETTTDYGLNYKTLADGSHEYQGLHVMVSFMIDGTRYLMEPQIEDCEYYDREFVR